MGRGRRAKPAEVKALMGNPGKRRHALQGASAGKNTSAPPKPLRVPPPEYLTQAEEKQYFELALKSLPANIARKSDVNALARWAAWLHVWVTCKKSLDGRQHWYTTTSEHSPEIHREHPLAKRMDKAEAHLVTLEDRLCLNIVARNNVIHRLFNMPGAHPGGDLFGDDLPPDEKTPTAPDGAEAEPVSALGFLKHAGDQKHLN